MKSADFWAGDKMHLRAWNRLKAVWWQLKGVGPTGVFCDLSVTSVSSSENVASIDETKMAWNEVLT